MKKIFLIIALTIAAIAANAQSCYWVALTDKAGTTFDPYSYFDNKAIERYKLNNADLYDITNYPLNANYVSQIDAIAIEEVGQSRWFNAVAVMATPDQIVAIEELPFVREVVPIGNNMQPASHKGTEGFETVESLSEGKNITDQLLRMRGDIFVEKGYNGTGIRIAVFDGGFHAVNTHQAFKHLRDNNQIVATWNFTNKTADVYDNHSHGTMVLSCIAGKMGDKLLGLATGATFLLAKTEVDPEPFKEEVWWAQAVEWADKNGADIINSSLGYTQDRHYTWQMDGRSYVSKAANLAARKGILVCNSAGNSGEDENWKIIGAPADADSILSVGGIQPSLTTYQHIGFSSYGPTADGRMKPNVCNYGYAEVADTHDDTATTYAAGTSFSSPLTTGFCACAMQVFRDYKLTAMQMKEHIERSADLYPYYDYALGYGVPQANYFTEYRNSNIEVTQPTFRFEQIGNYLVIHPTTIVKRVSFTAQNDGNYTTNKKESVIMFKIQDKKGLIKNYVNLGIEEMDPEKSCVAIPKGAIYGHTLVAHVNGYTDSIKLKWQDKINFAEEDHTFDYHIIDTAGFIQENIFENGNRSLADNAVSNWGVGKKYTSEVYFQYGIHWFFPYTMRYSDAYNVGFRFLRHFSKWYALGASLEITDQFFRYDPAIASCWDNTLAITDFTNVEKKRFLFIDANLELFQRIRIINTGKTKKGLHWDLGIYGGMQGNNYMVQYNAAENNNNAVMQTNTYSDVEPASNWNWGLTTRLVWNWIGIYGRYRMSQPSLDLPRLELGIQLSF
ncbi:MAG: S8 family serine peptidase [Bacteroidales bacterium]|nr:S8 family serine peptidase [Bacteroidales bacterium]